MSWSQRWVVAALVLALPRVGAAAAPWAEFEAGAAFAGYNDVRIPGNGGTAISLTDDLESDPAFAWRLRAGATFGGRHDVFLMAAPLRITSSGSVGYAVQFNGTTFPAQAPLAARYRFDSYRLTYRYDFVRRPTLRAGAGITGKIRDAAIRLQNGALVSEKTNTGFVPLIAFLFDWSFAEPLGLRIEGDALAAPQGRAEDVLFSLRARASRGATCYAGYRILEGGADNDEVYNFALVHYAVAGVRLAF